MKPTLPLHNSLIPEICCIPKFVAVLVFALASTRLFRIHLYGKTDLSTGGLIWLTYSKMDNNRTLSLYWILELE